MSLTLPNTYTEYVPLDILQASQLNNDNENNQYIADNVPALSDIVAGTEVTTTSGVGWITNTPKEVASVSLAAGTYFIEGSVVVNGSGQSIVVALRTGSATGTIISGSETLTTANQFYLTAQPKVTITLAVQTTIYLTANHTGGNNADLYGQNSISYVKIK